MPQQRRVVIAARDDRLRRSLREGLEGLGFVTWGEAGDGLAALAQARRARPHLVALALPLPGLDGAQVAESLIRSAVAPVLLVLPDQGESAERDAAVAATTSPDHLQSSGHQVSTGEPLGWEEAVCARLVRPFSQQSLAEAAEAARQRFDRLLVIRAELQRLHRERGGARLLERAKSLLMRRFRIGEPEAFWRIQRYCLDSEEPARVAVEALIDAHRLVLETEERP